MQNNSAIKLLQLLKMKSESLKILCKQESAI